MNVKVYGIYRIHKFGYEFEGELIHEDGDFFVLKNNRGTKYTFHKSTHRYEDVFTEPFPVGSYVHLTHKQNPSDSSYQKDPVKVIAYKKYDNKWNIIVQSELSKNLHVDPYKSPHLLDNFIIVQMPQSVVDAYFN